MTENPARILALLHDAWSGQGGIAKFNRDFFGVLEGCDLIETVAMLARSSQEATAIQSFQKLEPASPASSFLARFLSVMLKPGPIDAIICAHINFMPLALALHHRTGAPVTLIIHGVDAWDEPKRIFLFRALANLHRVIAVSDYSFERFRSWAPVRPGQGLILPNCTDFQRFSPGPVRQDLVDRFDLAGRRVLLTLGRLSALERYKGFDELMEVLPALSDNVVLVIAGDGDDRSRLESRAGELGVSDRVRFTGFIGEAEKVDLYRLADAFSLAGFGEGFGIVLLEAMGCGVPVVASCRDASVEVVDGGKLGLVADPASPGDLADKLTQALEKGRGEPPAGLEQFSDVAYRDRLISFLPEMLDRDH